MKIVCLTILFFMMSKAFAYEIESVNLVCGTSPECIILDKKVSEMSGMNISLSEIRERLKFMALDESIKNFEYEVRRLENDKLLINLNAAFYKKIVEIEWKNNKEIEIESLQNFVPVKTGDFVFKSKLEESLKIINQYLSDRGYVDNKIEYSLENVEEGINIEFDINIGKIIKVDSIKLTTDNETLIHPVKKRLHRFSNEPYNKLDIKVALDEISKELLESGYYFSKIILKKTEFDSSRNMVEIKVHIHFGRKFNFYFEGNNALTRFELMEVIKSSITTDYNEVSKELIEKALLQKYESMGLYRTSLTIRKIDTESKDGTKYRNYYVELNEGKKIKISNLGFQGNLRLLLEELEDIYYDSSSALADRDYLDEKYLKDFPKILKKEYLRRGFVFADVSEAKVQIDQIKNTATVFYSIKERQQCIVDTIEVKGLPPELRDEVLSVLANKSGAALNLVEIESDLSKALNYVRNKGYYFAKIANISDRSIVSYNNSNTTARITIVFDTGKITNFETALVTGHIATKVHVIEREVTLSKGDVITPSSLNKIRENISSLGLFSTVKLTPYITNKEVDDDNYRVNLLIQVKEKDFGVGEIAPGYRTDIGAKFSTLFAYNNLWGRNHSASAKLQLNYRLENSNLDARRRAEDKKRLEGLFRLNYTWPYFLNWLDASMTTSFQRKRFSAFDADIFRISPKFSKEFTDYFSTSLTYQLERIRQFDATEEKDEDTFRIGSLTPAITFDFRDHPINTRKGSFFRLSWEFANPDFSFNPNDEDNKIDFSKLVSRNRFYIPYKNVVLALSVSAGVQWNNSREQKRDDSGNIILNDDGFPRTIGYIPSIKVFRLDGFDVVRGFSDSEINRIASGQDINELRVQKTAFFTNIKVEPRYYFDDSIVVGLFFDAGRLFVDHYKPVDLRTSAGLSFKFLTPVGTLDFDYGVKLKRDYLLNGSRESFGRFHLSIGYF